MRTVAGSLVVVMASTLVLQPISERLLRPAVGHWLAWPASIWLGVGFLLLVVLGLSELAIGVGALLSGGELGSASELARVRAVVVIAVVVTLSALGIRSALGPPALRRVELALDRWPAALDGFRIVQISDLHIGPILDRRFARELTDRVNALEPDLVAVTGDLVDGRVALLKDEVAPFADLRGRHGVFFVTGNHDHYSGAQAWATVVSELGIRVLRNEHVEIRSDGAAFTLAGVDDHRAGMLPGEEGEDLEAALADLPSEQPVVLLAHDPSTFTRAAGMGVDLQLSGHTHGGQIWPFRYVVRLAIPFVEGVHRRGAAQLYVSRGTGFWGPPMRLGAPAELTEIVLLASR